MRLRHRGCRRDGDRGPGAGCPAPRRRTQRPRRRRQQRQALRTDAAEDHRRHEPRAERVPDEVQARRRPKPFPERREPFTSEPLADGAGATLRRPRPERVGRDVGDAPLHGIAPRGPQRVDLALLFGGERHQRVDRRRAVRHSARLRRPVQRDAQRPHVITRRTEHRVQPREEAGRFASATPGSSSQPSESTKQSVAPAARSARPSSARGSVSRPSLVSCRNAIRRAGHSVDGRTAGAATRRSGVTGAFTAHAP